MPNLTFVEPTEVTRVAKSSNANSARMAEYEAIVASVMQNKGKVLRIEPTGEDTARSLRLRVAQATTRMTEVNPDAANVVAWTSPDGVVFAEYQADSATRRAKAKAKAESNGGSESPEEAQEAVEGDAEVATEVEAEDAEPTKNRNRR